MAKMKRVRSSNLYAIGYDAKKHELYVEFKSGSVYKYSDVDRREYQKLLTAPSKGKYFSANIRNDYEFELVN